MGACSPPVGSHLLLGCPPPGPRSAQPGPMGLRAPQIAQGGQPLLLIKDQGMPSCPHGRGGPMHPKSLQTPAADCFFNITTKCVLLACPVYSSLVLFVLRNGEIVGRASAGFPQGCRLGWVWFLVNGSPGAGTHQQMVIAQLCIFANPHFSTCRWGWVGAGSSGEEINGGVMVLPCGSHRWRMSGCSVSPPQLSHHLSSPSLLQPEPLVLAPSGTPHGAGSRRWALGGSSEG